MHQNELFSILDSIESTNNYAMAKVNAGTASNGQAWFAKEQWGGKGQRGKSWESCTGENIILSTIVKPSKLLLHKPFLLSTLVAKVCAEFVQQHIKEEVKIKWPNDIYIGDRKAGGILIENKFKGKEWQWAVVGVGINVNQTAFEESVINPTSLKRLTGENYDPIILGKKLHEALLNFLEGIAVKNLYDGLDYLNIHLYKKGEIVQLRKDNAVFKTTIRLVNEYGCLLTKDVMERKFEVGEVAWIK